MKIRLFLYILFILCCANNMMGQNGSVSGTVRDASTNEPLIGVNIQSGLYGTTTDADGKYQLTLSTGKHTFAFSYVGYGTVRKPIDILENQTITIDVSLAEGENLLETATVTAGKFEKPLGEVTVSLEVLKPKLLETTNTVSIDQVLDKVPSVSIIDGQANIRGGSGYSYGAGSRVLLLVDDLPALQGDAGFPNWTFVPVENIDQVEVVKGAASALYGSSAMNGIINIRTAYPTSEPVTKVAAFTIFTDSPKDKSKKWWSDTTETPNSTGLSFAHRQKFGKFDLVLGGYGVRTQSFRKDAFTRYARINANTRYRLTDKISFGVNLNTQIGRNGNFFLWQNDTSGVYLPLDGTITNNTNSRVIIDPFLTIYDNNDGRHKLLGRYYRIANIQSNDANDQSIFTDQFYGEYQYQKYFNNQDLNFTAGIVGNYINTQAALYGDSLYNASNSALYVQLDKKIDKLNISLGARYERNQISSPNTQVKEARPVFRFGLNYQAADFTYFRASFGQGYRFPTIAEKFVSTCVGTLCIYPNSGLLSETGWSSEIGVKQGFKVSEFKGYIDVAAFWMEYQDMMEFTFGQYGNPLIDPFFGAGFSSVNIGNTVIKGFDISIVGQGKLGGLSTTALIGYAYIDPKFKDFSEVDTLLLELNENVLKYRFEHTIKYDMETQLNQFNIGLAVLYNSYMRNIDQPFVLFIPGLERYRAANMKGSTVVNARVGYQATDNLKVSFIIKNLFNVEYTLRPAFPESPRNFAFRVDYQW